MNSRHRLCSLLFSLVTGLTLAACSGGGAGSGSGTGPTGDFSIAVSPTTINLVQGASATSASVTATPLHGLTGNVSVSITGLPAGVSSSPASPFTVALGSSVAVAFTASNTASLGPAVIGLQATQGSLNHSASAAVSVAAAPNFGLAVSPSSVTVVPGGTASVNLLATPLNGFSGNITVGIGGLPSGISAPSSVTLAPGVAYPVTFSASTKAVPGTVSVSFSAVSGSIAHSADATMQVQSTTVQDFSIGVAPGMVALSQGSRSAPVTVAVKGLNGYTGSVSVAVSGLPAGVSASDSTMTIDANGTGQFTLSASSGAKPESGVATLTATSGSLSHSANLMVAVDASGTAFSTTYFYMADSGAADETINILNPGIQSTSSSLPTLCANIYVFDEGEELKECCSCPITANGTLELSVNNDLTLNPGNGLPFAEGQGELDVVPGTVPSTGICDAANPVPAPDLTVWATHVAPSSASSGTSIVEAPASDLSLSGSNLTTLTSLCGFIEGNDSGSGVCTCGTGTDVRRSLVAKR
jgi:hypothetical protein